jgi:O-antigen ligase
MTFDRAAFATLLLLTLSFGFGDITQGAALDVVRALVPLAITLTLFAAVKAGRWPSFPRRLAWPMAGLLTVLLLSAAFAPTNNVEAIAALERPASGALLAWAVYVICHTSDRWRRLARAFAVGGFGVALIGLGEASGVPTVVEWLRSLHAGSVPIGDVPRITSTLSHPNVAAILLELTLPLLVAWAWTAALAWRIPLGVGVVASLIALVLTFSRAGIFAALVSLTIMAGLAIARGERRAPFGLALAALAVPVALVCAAMTDPGLDRRLTAGLDESSGASPSRLTFWSAAGQMLADHPLLGVGPDNYRWQFARYSGLAENNLGIHAHDQYVEALADTGILGLAALGWLLVSVVRVATNGLAQPTHWPWRAALLASLSAWLLHAVLDDFERFWPASVAFWLIVGLSLRLQFSQDREQTRGRVALAHEQVDAGPKRLAPLLRATAQGHQTAAGVSGAQAVEAPFPQTGQIPVQQNHVGLGAPDLVDQTIGALTISHE